MQGWREAIKNSGLRFVNTRLHTEKRSRIINLDCVPWRENILHVIPGIEMLCNIVCTQSNTLRSEFCFNERNHQKYFKICLTVHDKRTKLTNVPILTSRLAKTARRVYFTAMGLIWSDKSNNNSI